MDLERQLQSQRAHRLDEQFTNSPVDAVADEALADALGVLDAPSLADVLRQLLAVAHVIAHGHPLPTAPAHDHAL